MGSEMCIRDSGRRRTSGPDTNSNLPAENNLPGDMNNRDTNNNSPVDRTESNQRRRRRGKRGPKSDEPAPSSPRTEQALEFINDSLPDSGVPPPINNTDGGKNRQRPRGKPNRSGETGEAEAQDVNAQAPQTIKKKKRRPRNRRPKSTKPWLVLWWR